MYLGSKKKSSSGLLRQGKKTKDKLAQQLQLEGVYLSTGTVELYCVTTSDRTQFALVNCLLSGPRSDLIQLAHLNFILGDECGLGELRHCGEPCSTGWGRAPTC